VRTGYKRITRQDDQYTTSVRGKNKCGQKSYQWMREYAMCREDKDTPLKVGIALII
jgi:hypothetical protein